MAEQTTPANKPENNQEAGAQTNASETNTKKDTQNKVKKQTTPANKPENKAKGSDSGMKIHFVPEYGANVLAKNPAEAVKKAAAKFGRKGAK